MAAQGKSPTEELLADWGTTNCTVGELVDILNKNELLAAVTLLLPGMTLIHLLWSIHCNIKTQKTWCTNVGFVRQTQMFLIFKRCRPSKGTAARPSIRRHIQRSPNQTAGRPRATDRFQLCNTDSG